MVKLETSQGIKLVIFDHEVNTEANTQGNARIIDEFWQSIGLIILAFFSKFE